MLSLFLDLIVVFIFLYTAYLCWKVSKRQQKKQLVLLFKIVAIFIVLHLVTFPIIYLITINRNSSSIKIEKNIAANEKNIKLERAFTEKSKIEQKLLEKKQPELEYFFNNYKGILLKINWDSIDNKRILELDSFQLVGFSESKQVPGGGKFKIIQLYNSDGIKVNEFSVQSSEESLAGLFNDHLNYLKNEQVDIVNEIKSIKKNKFWSYRQILPYTLNILFTDNFTPQSRTANIIYFVHNILVVGFLISIIMNLFQYYLLNRE